MFAGVCPRLFGLLNRDSSFDGGTIVVIGNRARCGTAACKAGHYKALPQRNRDVCTAWFGHEFPSPPNAFGDLRLACYACVVMKNAPTRERHSERSASIARRVCWWQSAEATLEDTPRFLCQVMVFGTWEDVCFVLHRHGEAAFREALVSAPPGLFDNRSWHYWHHRLHVLPVPLLPQRTIPT